MKTLPHHKYGYKVCYIKKHTKTPIRRFITHDYRTAKSMKHLYYIHPPIDYNDIPIVDVKWEIYPITKREVIQGIWKECPF